MSTNLRAGVAGLLCGLLGAAALLVWVWVVEERLSRAERTDSGDWTVDDLR